MMSLTKMGTVLRRGWPRWILINIELLFTLISNNTYKYDTVLSIVLSISLIVTVNL